MLFIAQSRRSIGRRNFSAPAARYTRNAAAPPRNARATAAREGRGMKRIVQGARGLGPYLLVELLLPGGSLIALLLWLFRHYPKRGEIGVRIPAKHPDDAGPCAGACA
jgi:hypothetical protein